MTQERIQEVLIERNIKRALLQKVNIREVKEDDVEKDKKFVRESKENKDVKFQESSAVERKFDSD